MALTYRLLQIHLLQQGHEDLNRRTWETTRRLLPDGGRIVVYRQQYVAFLSLMEHSQPTLSLEGKARRKALAKARRLGREAPSPDGLLGPFTASVSVLLRPCCPGPAADRAAYV